MAQSSSAPTRRSVKGVYRSYAKNYWHNPRPAQKLLWQTERIATLVSEDFEGAAAGTSMTAGNTVFDLFNSAGTSTIEATPTPIKGVGIGQWVGQRVVKDTTTLPGTFNGGQPLKEWYWRGYLRNVANPSVANRLVVFEQSAANGGADICGFRINTDGTLHLGDGATYNTGGTTRTLSSTEWTRIEYFCDQRNQTQRISLWWGANLQTAGSSTYDETTSYQLLTTGDAETWGIGNYVLGTHTLYADSLAVGIGDWIGPVSGYNVTSTVGWGMIPI